MVVSSLHYPIAGTLHFQLRHYSRGGKRLTAPGSEEGETAPPITPNDLKDIADQVLVKTKFLKWEECTLLTGSVALLGLSSVTTETVDQAIDKAKTVPSESKPRAGALSRAKTLGRSWLKTLGGKLKLVDGAKSYVVGGVACQTLISKGIVK